MGNSPTPHPALTLLCPILLNKVFKRNLSILSSRQHHHQGKTALSEDPSPQRIMAAGVVPQYSRCTQEGSQKKTWGVLEESRSLTATQMESTGLCSRLLISSGLLGALKAERDI